MSKIRKIQVPIFLSEQPYALVLRLYWQCPKCGGPRGDIALHELNNHPVSHWMNPCGHHDQDIHAVIAEAIKNNLNKGLKKCSTKVVQK